MRVLLVAPILLVAACSSSREPMGPPPTPQVCASPEDVAPTPDIDRATTAQDFARVLNAIFCERALRCEGTGALFDSSTGFCNTHALEVAIARDEPGFLPDVRVDLEALRAALRALAAAPCVLRGMTLPATMTGFGTLADGAPCMADASCISDRCEQIDRLACGGQCAVRVAEGGPCSGGDCADGLGCLEGLCTPPGAAGAPCGNDDDCMAPAVCTGAVCGRLPGPGEPCDISFFDANCTEGLVCENGACVPGQPAGSVCGDLESGREAACAIGLHCTRDPSRSPAMGICVDVGNAGCLCTSTDACPESMVCHEGSCVSLPFAGEPCDDVRTCLEGACVAGTCTLLADGEPCSRELNDRPCEHDCDGFVFEPGVCRPFAAAGASCEDVSCADDLICDFDATPRTCVACRP